MGAARGDASPAGQAALCGLRGSATGHSIYESRKHPPLPRIHFLRRLALHVAGSTGLLLGSLLIGMAGYGYFEDLAWRDAFLNSAMLLGGMGPVDAPRTDGGKVFAGVYAAVRRPDLHSRSRSRVRTRTAPPVAQVSLGRRPIAARLGAAAV